MSIAAPLRPWMPSELLSAVPRLVAGAAAGEFVRAALLALAVYQSGRREL